MVGVGVHMYMSLVLRKPIPKRADNVFSDLLSYKSLALPLPFIWCIIRCYTRSGFDDIAT